MSSFSYFVGQRIKKYRKSRGYTIEQFSAMINKSKATVSKYENGTITIDVETLYDIARALDIDLKCFIDYQPPVFHAQSVLPKNFYFNQPRAYMYYYDGRVRQLVWSLLCFSPAASGDGIDSNGDIEVTGGELYISGPTSNGDGTIDCDGSATITGGIVVAAGSTGMAENFGTASTQGSILVNLSGSAGQTITLKDSDGNILASFTPAKAFGCVVVSAPGVAQGGTYTIAAGSASTTVTMESLIYGSGMGGFGGMGGGMGDPGNMGGGQQPPQGGVGGPGNRG